MSLNDLYNNVCIPEKLKSDRAQEFCGLNYEFLKSAKQEVIYLTYDEPEHKNQIAPIDVVIRELRKLTHNKMKETNTPRMLWDHHLVHPDNIRQFLPQDKLQGSKAMDCVTGKTLYRT